MDGGGRLLQPLRCLRLMGSPAPTYAVVGSLPGGISFNANTRVISGNPNSAGSGTIRIRATNSEGSADWTVDYTITSSLTAPSFADDTGDSQSWTVGQAISSITVPAASGNPTPTYAAVGSLPSGINFNTGTRVISGTPGSTGSGTIRIRATNSEGSDDWTVAYTIAAAPSPDLTVDTPTKSPTGNLTPGQSFTLSTTVRNEGTGTSASTTLRWRRSTNTTISTGDPQVGTDSVGSLAANGTSNESIVLTAPATPGTYYYGATVDSVSDESDTGNNASGALTVVVTVALTAPSFADDTGDAQSWTVGQAIPSLTVPAASGNPIPTYAVVGSLPGGISFSPSTRRITGTPNSVGSGTIRIRATNSEGTDDWTVAYSIGTVPDPRLVILDSAGREIWTLLEAGETFALVGSARAGTPTARGQLTVEAPAVIDVDLAGMAVAGSPTAVGRLTVSEGTPIEPRLVILDSVGREVWTLGEAEEAIDLVGSARLGTPTAVGRLSVGAGTPLPDPRLVILDVAGREVWSLLSATSVIDLEGVARAGNPEAMGTLRVDDATVNLSGSAVVGLPGASGRLTVDGVSAPIGKLVILDVVGREVWSLSVGVEGGPEEAPGALQVILITRNSAQLNFNSVFGATGYRYQVDDNMDFSSPLIDMVINP